jgi:F-type H+-transporting ATPase subunit delta
MKATKHTRHEAKQLFRLCLVNGLLEENRARQVVQHIVTAKPRGYLGTLSYFRRLLEIEQARRTAKIESARTLPQEMQARVRAGLTRLYGPGLSTAFDDNPALIGGMRIRVGSDVYDGSVQARLSALAQSF